MRCFLVRNWQVQIRVSLRLVCFVRGTWQVQICVGSSFGVFSGAKLAGANSCRVFAWCVLCGEPGRCKFVEGLRLVCFLWRNRQGLRLVCFVWGTWQVQICVRSSFGVFSVAKLAGANLCSVLAWCVLRGEHGKCKFA